MGRPRGSKNKPKVIETSPSPGAGHNQLTDEQLQALFFQHKQKYEAALATKKKADADFKNACKLAKSEVGDDAIERIKYAIDLEDEKGEARLKERMLRMAEVARWMGLEVGTQADLFPADNRPGDDRAYAEGKRHGMEGKERRPPHDPSTSQSRSWLKGYDDGQAVNRSKMQDAMTRPAKEETAAADPFEDVLPDGEEPDDEGESADAEWDAAEPPTVQ